MCVIVVSYTTWSSPAAAVTTGCERRYRKRCGASEGLEGRERIGCLQGRGGCQKLDEYKPDDRAGSPGDHLRGNY